MTFEPLLQRHKLISHQVTQAELRVVLRELQTVVQAQVAGAVVEFGCYMGTTSLFIVRLLQQLQDERQFHVYDSFEGLPPKSEQDRNAAGVDFGAGELAVSKKEFLRQFAKAKLAPPITHKAWFNELNDKDIPKPVAFAFLDGDFYDSILTSLELVYPRLAPGAVVTVHDFNRETLPGVERAVHDFCHGKGLSPGLRIEANIGILTFAK